MSFGEQAGGRNGGEMAQGEGAPEVLQSSVEVLTENEGLKEKTEQAPVVDPNLLGAAAVEAIGYGEKKQAELGEVTDEGVGKTEMVLSTETGTIKDEDGVQPEIKNRLEEIEKEPDLGERAVQARVLNINFLRGRYPNRADYMGSKAA